MKWYETPIEDLYERALLALACNDEDTYKENLIHAATLIRQRKFQTIGIQGRARLMDYYQGLDALLHMEQSKLRATTDDILKISLMGLMLDYYVVLGSDRFKDLKHRRQIIGLYKQAIKKIQAEMTRRTRVYGLSVGYWGRLKMSETIADMVYIESRPASRCGSRHQLMIKLALS